MKQLTFHETMVAYTKALTMFGRASPSVLGTPLQSHMHQQVSGQDNFDLALSIYLAMDKEIVDEEFVEIMLDHFPTKEVAEAFYNRTNRESSKLYLMMKWEL